MYRYSSNPIIQVLSWMSKPWNKWAFRKQFEIEREHANSKKHKDDQHKSNQINIICHSLNIAL